MTKSLGVNAQSFANHLTRGIEAAGLNVDDFQPGIVTHKEDGRIGFAICQLKTNGRTKKSVEKAFETMIVCFEDGIEWLLEGVESSMPINEQQPPSMLAVLFIAATLTKQPIFAPSCPECEASK